MAQLFPVDWGHDDSMVGRRAAARVAGTDLGSDAPARRAGHAIAARPRADALRVLRVVGAVRLGRSSAEVERAGRRRERVVVAALARGDEDGAPRLGAPR